MGRRRSVWSRSLYLKYLSACRGQGDLGEYKPWITVHDFPSMGKVARIRGQKTGRIHHLLSQLEKILFLILDNDPDVEDIKEQYPLPLKDTQLIAARLGLRHPEVNGYPYVMTTDIYYRRKGVWSAVQVKPSKELSSPRIQEKFAIEREYYQSRGIEWKVMTEKELTRIIGCNYVWLTAGEPIQSLIPDIIEREVFINTFLELYATTIPFRTIIRELDLQGNLRPGTTIQLFKHLISCGRIKLDLTKRVNLDEPRSHLIFYGT